MQSSTSVLLTQPVPTQGHQLTKSMPRASSNARTFQIALVGIGHRGYKTHFQNVRGSRLWAVAAVCDTNEPTTARFSEQHPDVPAYSSLKLMLQNHDLDFAIVSVPHRSHMDVCKALAEANVPILKEKPVADCPSDYVTLLKLPVRIGVTFQRRFEPRYLELKKLLPQIGEIASFRATLAINIEDLSTTWRASDEVGVTDDLGSHMLDLIVWLFGGPTSITAQNASAVRRDQSYGGDDISDIMMKFQATNTIGQLHLSRVADSNEETLVVIGTNGTLCLNDREVAMRDSAGVQTSSFVDQSSKQFVIRSMLRHFGDWIDGSAKEFHAALPTLRDTVKVMEALKQSMLHPGAPQSLEQSQPLDTASLSKEHHVWPLLTADSEKAIVEQMHSSLSIYDRSNIYEMFEDRWRKMHGLKHALVCSSGTIAIWHMFEALELRPGDEILCPVYTFFATSTPMLQYGAVPVFCDALPDGNFNPDEVLKRSTAKTKAVIVTHMWGLPCRMKDIMSNASRVNGGIKVLEDCSHAHGAMVDGKLTGSWGHMAAWSLQAKKNLTGGQAGVMATNSSDYYSRAVLHGHFNKRAKQEVPTSHPLRKFWLTGLGLNLRAHPLAIALTNQQLTAFPTYDYYRQKYASHFAERLGAIPFLHMPQVSNASKDKHAWYAFVMRFLPSDAPPGLTRDSFVEALHKRGLKEVDIPRSTGLLNELPLFTHAHEAIPRFGDQPWSEVQKTEEFPIAKEFFDHAIKLPIWATPGDHEIVEFYVGGFLEEAGRVLGKDVEIVAERRQDGEDPVAGRLVQARL